MNDSSRILILSTQARTPAYPGDDLHAIAFFFDEISYIHPHQVFSEDFCVVGLKSGKEFTLNQTHASFKSAMSQYCKVAGSRIG